MQSLQLNCLHQKNILIIQDVPKDCIHTWQLITEDEEFYFQQDDAPPLMFRDVCDSIASCCQQFLDQNGRQCL